jgi:MFS family permease
MEFILALPLLFIPLVLPFIAGQMAKSFGRKFWPWFLIGIVLPFIANIILLCLPDKSKKKTNGLKAVENDKIFDHLFIAKDSQQQSIHSGTHFAA